MRARTAFAVLALAPGLAAQPPGDLLQRATAKVLDTVERLPRYLCTQTVDRQQYRADLARRGPSCEPDPHKKLTLMTTDRLRLDVAVSQQEMYSWVGESHFDDRGLFDLVRNGALQTGAFSSFLALIFRDDNSGFAFQGPVNEGGRALDRFDFRVPVSMSHYLFRGIGGRVTTGYYGHILVDPVTADLVRLEVHTEGLPPETGACLSSTALDYTRMRLNDADFLLPARAELFILDANGTELKNTTVYSGCREFMGESTLHFEAEPEPAAGPGGRPAAVELPAGLPFTVALTREIDPAVAAAGDRIPARLAGPIRDAQGQALVPANTVVTVRILQIRRFYVPVAALRLALRLETVAVDGAPRPLLAEPDTSLPPPAPSRAGLPRRRNTAMADNQDRHTVILDLVNLGGGLKVPTGFESKWFTAAIQP